MEQSIERLCHDERHFKSVLYMMQSLTDEEKQLRLLEEIHKCNFYYSVRIAHHLHLTERFRSIFTERLQICSVQLLQHGSAEISAIIPPLYAALLLDEEETFRKLAFDALFPLLQQSEESHLHEALSTMYASLEKDKLITLFSLLGQQHLFAYIDPDQLYGKCIESETETLRKLLLAMYQEDDASLIPKLVQIGFQCSIDGLFPNVIQRKKVLEQLDTSKCSIDLLLYVCFGILDGETISDLVFPKIMRMDFIISKREFYDFLIGYAQHDSIPYDAIYLLAVRARKLPSVQECVQRIIEENPLSPLSMKMQQSIKQIDYFNMCRSKPYQNVAKFMVQNNDNPDSRKEYFSLMTKSNIYLAATVINTMYYNSDDLEEIFDNALHITITKLTNKTMQRNPINLQYIVATLLITGRYDEFEAFMKNVFCPFLINNKVYLGILSSYLPADKLFILICSMARNGVGTKIFSNLIREHTVEDKAALQELLQNLNKLNTKKGLQLIVTIAQKYNVQNVEDMLGITNEELDAKICSTFIKKRDIQLVSFLKFRKPVEKLNDIELEQLGDSEKDQKNSESIIAPRRLFYAIYSHTGSMEPDSDMYWFSELLKETTIKLDGGYLPLLQDEKKITGLLDKFRIYYNSGWDLKKKSVCGDFSEYLQLLQTVFGSYRNVYNIIKTYFSLIQLYAVPLEVFMCYLYKTQGCNNDYLRYLLNDYVLSGLVKKTKGRNIYVYSTSFVTINNSLPVTWCNGKVLSSSGEGVTPGRKEKIYCKIHSFDSEKNTVLLRCPAYSEEDCEHYNKILKGNRSSDGE